MYFAANVFYVGFLPKPHRVPCFLRIFQLAAVVVGCAKFFERSFPMRNGLLFAGLLVAVVVLGFSSSALAAGCPDEVQCRQRMINLQGEDSQQVIGTISVDCCYKFPTGCRPWHCDGVEDKGYLENMAHWQTKCNEKFPVCKDDHAGMTEDTCTPHFKTY